MDDPTILISVCNTGWVHKHVTMALVRMMMAHPNATIILPTHRPYEQSLNRVCKDFLAGDFDFWFNMDADNPVTKDPLDLTRLDCDILGFPTPVWANMKEGDRPYYYNAMMEKEDGWMPAEGAGLTEVDAMGSGCWLIARRVIEKVPRPWFMREYDPDGVVVKGHDYLFCEKARKSGFKVWTHFDYPCQHFNEVELNEVIRAFNQMK